MYEGQMISSGLNNPGDIVLASEKKSHKKWIIIGAVILVFIVVIVVMFLVPRIGGSKMSGDAKPAFNRFANYLFYGEDSTEVPEGEYSEDYVTALESATEGDVNSATFANNLDTLWSDYTKKSSDFTIGDGVTRDSYGERVSFMVTYLHEYSNINDDEIINLTLNNSSNEAEQSIDEYFALFDDYSFDEAEVFKEDGRTYYQNIVDWAKGLSEAGCNSEESIENAECSSLLDEGELNMLKNYSNFRDDINNIASYLVKNAWVISSQVNGGNK